MDQRYRVFLNDRTIEISEIINKNDLLSDTQMVPGASRSQYQLALQEFYSHPEIPRLLFFTEKKLSDAWRTFRSVFQYIEASGGVVRNSRQEFLFIYRFNTWDLPKGKLEKGETPRLGAIREVKEETGLVNVKILQKLEPTYHLYPDKKGFMVLKKTHWFLMEAAGEQTLKPQVDEDISEVRWIPATQPDLVLPNTYASLQPLIKQFLTGQLS